MPSWSFGSVPSRSSLCALSLRALLVLASLGAARSARADAPLPAHAPAGAGQPALSAFSAPGGDVMVASCSAAPCSTGAVSLNVPAELRSKPPRAEVVAIGEGRHAMVVSLGDGPRSFRAVVAAPLGGGGPKVLFAGLTGLVSGQPGDRRGPMVQVSDAEDGVRRVLVGEELESVTLCGRSAILAPRLLNPKNLELQGARVQRLPPAERSAARALPVRRLPDDEPSAAARGMLSALYGSSGIGAPQAVADGDPETTWSEDVGGDGRGEFVVLRSPPETAIAALELGIRPKTRSVEGGAAPEHFYLATPREVFSVTLPDDAWTSPGARYRVTFDRPIQTSCLALSLDSSFDRGKTAKVTIAEMAAVTEFDPSKLEGLVAALAGGGQRAEAAKSVLAAGGEPAFTAVAAAFDKLDEGGRRVALQVMDSAPCELGAPVYVAALTSKFEAQVQHAQSRLQRCGAAAGDALSSALSRSDKTDKQLFPLLVDQLASSDPARAIGELVPLLDEAAVRRRRKLRSSLAQAARSPKAAVAVRAALGNPNTPAAALIDLLRALGERAADYQPEAAAALTRLQQGSPSFRTRYLLLGPSAVLGRVSADASEAFRRSLRADPDPHVRAAALQLVREPSRFRSELLAALNDSEVRVREASVRALATPDAAFASQSLTERLKRDEWPLVRASAADALARHPRGAALDQPLVDGLSDDSPLVRARSIRALGERRAAGVGDRIRERLIDAEEWPEVRAEAARALGTLCDNASVDVLAAFARKLADPMASADAQLIAAGAITSLGRLAPSNLKDLLAPLSAKKAPPQARRAALAASSATATCRAKKP